MKLSMFVLAFVVSLSIGIQADTAKNRLLDAKHCRLRICSVVQDLRQVEPAKLTIYCPDYPIFRGSSFTSCPLPDPLPEPKPLPFPNPFPNPGPNSACNISPSQCPVILCASPDSETGENTICCNGVEYLSCCLAVCGSDPPANPSTCKKGPCQSGPGPKPIPGDCTCTLQYAPVCCSGKQFSNACFAGCDGYSNCDEGPCNGSIFGKRRHLLSSSCEDRPEIMDEYPSCCEEYEVKEGENLCDVADYFELNCNELAEFNDVAVDGDLVAGDMLQICPY
eukprot:TRINITY_DN10394_c0_g4_i1.p2 TRINITY_DN10394_c0_g4~~TRINITY_DN10394_c0_g4_i1.p2  ORF type:complete len:291 (+),score=23.68 TRINITY_DN10394_c0_g4_i1:39-875(+)